MICPNQKPLNDLSPPSSLIYIFIYSIYIYYLLLFIDVCLRSFYVFHGYILSVGYTFTYKHKYKHTLTQLHPHVNVQFSVFNPS